MSILFDESSKVFKLDTKNTTYAFQAIEDDYLVSLYYGSRVPDEAFDMHHVNMILSFHPMREDMKDGSFSADITPLEYSGFNSGDLRQTAVAIENQDGNKVTDFRYVSHEIYPGKKKLPGLPATFGNEQDVTSLEVVCKDPVTDITCILIYSVFEENDVITRSVCFENTSANTVFIDKAYSASVNLRSMDYDMVHLDGFWAAERNLSRAPLRQGQQGISSLRGSSSHLHNPFVALMGTHADEDQGDVYAFHLIYSNNYKIEADCDFYETTRVNLGIHPETFRWKLVPNDTFQTPEAVLTYTNKGLGEMSRILHRFYLDHLIRSKYTHVKRPLLINCWEAVHMNVNTETMVRFAKTAAKMGIDLLVMDDGWFGHRVDDRSSLGDWQPDPNKFPTGMKDMINQVNALGLKFGIWFEPEMISPDSDLYRAHPDWCVHVPSRDLSLGRHQLVLDFSRADVRDYIFSEMEKVLSQNNIEYLKWDFNRNLSEAGSAILPKDQEGEFYHRFALGTYDVMDRITKRFPNILFENCSGGGGRFDLGMLYYSPQIWSSDNTDPIDRLAIQFGTSVCYPASSMGAHVSICNRTGYETKANVALWGTFGFELDPDHIIGKDMDICKKKIAEYHQFYDLIHEGDLYRLTSTWENTSHVAWSFVSRDKSEMLYTRVTIKKSILDRYYFIQKFKGLDPDKMYKLTVFSDKADSSAVNATDHQRYSGAYLMNVGLYLNKLPMDDGDSYMLHFQAVEND